MRWAAVGAGVILIAAAFAAATRVADTREGLVYEIVTLLAGLAGVSLLLYGLVATLSRPRPTEPTRAPAPTDDDKDKEVVHNAGELVVGAAGLVVAAILIAGIATTGGLSWALLGTVLLLPMIAGGMYLCFTFARGPHREWKIDLKKLRSQR